MTAPLTVPAALRRAEQIIGQLGWCQNGFVAADGRVCPVGAVRIAVTGHANPHVDLTDEQWDLIEAGYDALCEYVGQSPELWNDGQGRTATEVRHALLRAADKAEHHATSTVDGAR